MTSGSSSKAIPSHPRLSGSANSVNISGHPLSLSLTILAGATWRIRALSDAIRVSRSICSISAKNALNLHIFEAASCHIASGHGGRPDCSPCSVLSASLQRARGLSMCQVSEEGRKHYACVIYVTWVDGRGLRFQVWTPRTESLFVNQFGDC